MIECKHKVNPSCMRAARKARTEKVKQHVQCVRCGASLSLDWERAGPKDQTKEEREPCPPTDSIGTGPKAA